MPYLMQNFPLLATKVNARLPGPAEICTRAWIAVAIIAVHVSTETQKTYKELR